MDVKLTLSLDKEIIEKAKSYAKNEQTSLSRMVENYFSFLVRDETPSYGKEKSDTPISDSLLGIAALEEGEEFDEDKIKEEYLTQKYLHD